MHNIRNLPLVIFITLGCALSMSCTENSSTFYVDKPEMIKREKVAIFYGPQAKKNCELYRKLNAGFCDTASQPFITCYDINDKKYKFSSCE